MIIKSLSRREASFGQLIGYISRKPDPQSLQQTVSYANQLAETIIGYINQDSKDQRDHTPPFSQNLGELIAPQSIAAAFRENASLLPQRKNGVMLYHEILSFHDNDSPHITPAIAGDLARYYLSLRAPNAPAYARVHTDTDNIHVHILLAANDLGSGKRNWMTRAQFNAIKQQTEAYQRHRYPQLAHSLAQPVDDRADKRVKKNELVRGPFGQADKHNHEDLAELFRQCLVLATSRDDLDVKLRDHGFVLTVRGKTQTLVSATTAQRARLSIFGVAADLEAAELRWQQLPTRLDALEQDHIERQRAAWRQEGFAARMLAVIKTLNKPISRMGRRLAQLRETALGRFRDGGRAR